MIPRHFKLFPYVQIGLHPHRAAQFFVGILRQQHSRRLSLGCYLQGFGFGRQSPTLERRAAELEQLGPREGLELEGARDELLLVPRWSRQRFLIIPNKRCSDKREPHPSLNRVIGGFSN